MCFPCCWPFADMWLEEPPKKKKKKEERTMVYVPYSQPVSLALVTFHPHCHYPVWTRACRDRKLNLEVCINRRHPPLTSSHTTAPPPTTSKLFDQNGTTINLPSRPALLQPNLNRDGIHR